jgi:hypothetical protein
MATPSSGKRTSQSQAQFAASVVKSANELKSGKLQKQAALAQQPIAQLQTNLTSIQTELKNYVKTQWSPAQKTWITAQNAYKPYQQNPSHYTSDQLLAASNTYNKALATWTNIDQGKTNLETSAKDVSALLTKQQANYNSIEAQIAKDKILAAGGTPPPTTSTGGSNAGGSGLNKTKKAPPAQPYVYNAPMVKTAYFGPLGPQIASAGNSILVTTPPKDVGSFQWTGKGAIQMSQTTLQSLATSNPTTQATTASNAKNVFKADKNAYGFKFLYNPTSISMSWGLVDSFSPPYEATGQDPASAVGSGLMASTVSFSLMLNRIGDMSVLAPSGQYVVQPVSQSEVEVNLKERNVNGVPSLVFDGPNHTDIYPFPVSLEDRQLIYKKGTMYDLEYFFKATGGYDATYMSTLNGPTADYGWLQPIPVELHLGDGMRYLVRINSLDVQHIMFNERMVPILTQVDISCTRYIDNAAFTNGS